MKYRNACLQPRLVFASIGFFGIRLHLAYAMAVQGSSLPAWIWPWQHGPLLRCEWILQADMTHMTWEKLILRTDAPGLYDRISKLSLASIAPWLHGIGWHWQCCSTSVLPVVILWLTRDLKISPFVLPKQIQHHLSNDCLTSYNLQRWNLLKRIRDHETSWKQQRVISVSQAEFQPQAWLSECIPAGIMSPATTGTQALANIMWATATLKKENAPRSKVSDSKRLWWVLTRSISKFIWFTKLENNKQLVITCQTVTLHIHCFIDH